MEGWSGLPPDVLTSVMARLNLADQVRMSAVCTGWCLVSMDISRRPPPLPALWLLLRQSCKAPASPRFVFASFSEGMRTYALGLRYEDCIGSSQGWLMVVDEFGGLHAVDPITGTRIPLLSDDVVPTDGDSATVATAPVHRYRRSIFVPPRDSGSGSAVAAAVIRLGDAEFPELTFVFGGGVSAAWVSPDVAFPGFEDIAAHDGKLYALSSDSRVVVFDLGSDPSSSPPTAVSVIQTQPDRRRFQRKHLGVMAGNLVMLQWRYCRPCPFRLRRCIPEFQVFRLQMGAEPKWVELEDLGGYAMLLGTDGFTALPTGEFPELRSNCIYSLPQTSDHDDGGSVLEVVDLKSRAVAVEPLCETSAAPIWFRPTRSSFSALWINWHPAEPSPSFAGKLQLLFS